jgi:hypothetical protein
LTNPLGSAAVHLSGDIVIVHGFLDILKIGLDL